MNDIQKECLSRLFFAFNKSIVIESIGDLFILKTPNKITNPIQFNSTNIYKAIDFLWHKAKNMNLVLVDDQRTHKIVVVPYSKDGKAKFSMQIELKSQDTGYESVGYVENLLLTDGKVVKTYIANSPKSVLNTMSLEWINQLKSILNEFNSYNFSTF